MLLTKIHRRRVVTTISFKSSLFLKLRQIFNCPLKLKIFNLLGSGIGCNSLLVLENIIFSKGPNMAPRRFCVRSHDQLLHRGNFDVNSYFWFYSFNVDFDLSLFCHVQGSKAFLNHCVKLSSLINKKYIPTFSLQCLVHLLPHTSCQHNCHLLMHTQVPGEPT
jgi:hypothetical protein